MIRSPLLSDLFSLSRTLDQLTGYRSGESQTNGSGDVSWVGSMPIDVYATDDEAVLIAAVPGMEPDDLDLTVHQNTVILRGTVRSSTDSEGAKNATWYVSELASGTYQRSVTLPFPIDADHAEATFERGLVRVTLPKAESAKAKRISISNSDNSSKKMIGSTAA